MPAPLGLAFVNILFHCRMPLPLGILFHLTRVTFWGTVFVLFARPRASPC